MASQRESIVKYAYLEERSGTWVVRIKYVDPSTGKLASTSRTTGLLVKDHTKRKAKAMVEELSSQVEESVLSQFPRQETESDKFPEPKPEPAKTVVPAKFSDYVEKYIHSKEIDGTASTSLVTYTRVARNVLCSSLGDVDIKDFTKSFIQDFLAEQRESYPIDTIKLNLSVLKWILDVAVDDGLLNKNPAEGIRIGNGDSMNEKEVYTTDQLRTFLKYMEGVGEPYLSVVVLGGIYGLRRGEMLGLRWSDIDFQTKTINIKHTVTQVNGTVFELDKAKTRSSIRTLYMLNVTVPYFQKVKQAQIDAGLELDKVCRHLDGRYIKPAFLSKHIPQLMERCGLPRIRLHDLRGTALTLLSKAPGVSIKQVADFAGHSNVSTTLQHYIHLANEDRINTTKAYEKAFFGGQD